MHYWRPPQPPTSQRRAHDSLAVDDNFLEVSRALRFSDASKNLFQILFKFHSQKWENKRRKRWRRNPVGVVEEATRYCHHQLTVRLFVTFHTFFLYDLETKTRVSPDRPSKRMKNGKKHSTNGTSNEIVTLNHDGSERYVVRREELVRVLLQSLDNLGYEKTRGMLESESGICMESKDVIRFKKYVYSVGVYIALILCVSEHNLHQHTQVRTEWRLETIHGDVNQASSRASR